MKRGLLTALLLFGLGTPVLAGVIEGRVVQGDLPVAGVQVGAYANLDFSGTPLVLSAPTADDGQYRLELPTGGYALYVVAPQLRLFAFCGRNPVTVDNTPQWAGLQAVSHRLPTTRPYEDATSTAVEGRVMADGAPLSDAYVYLYIDAEDALKGQGYRMSQPTDAEGRFYFDGLPETSYFLVARKRAQGGRVGPVLNGDWLGIYPGNPLSTRAGMTQLVEIPAVQKIKSETSSETFAVPGGPQMEGVVVDRAGQPVAGLHVFAYRDRVIGHKRPETLSAPTTDDGRFVLNFAAAGIYYIGARQYYGDSPAPDELFGMYGGSPDHGLDVGAKPLKEVRIVVEPINLNE